MLSLDLPPGVSYEALIDQARLLMLSMSVDAVVQLEETSRAVEELEQENEDLGVRARTDELTGLPNRATLNEFLRQQVHSRLRDEVPGQLGVIMIDIDNFKGFNDRFGHPAGDEVLRSVGASLRQVVRRSDVLCRYGGEEFCLVVPHATFETLAAAGERLRAHIEGHNVDLGVQGPPARDRELRLRAARPRQHGRRRREAHRRRRRAALQPRRTPAATASRSRPRPSSPRSRPPRAAPSAVKRAAARVRLRRCPKPRSSPVRPRPSGRRRSGGS